MRRLFTLAIFLQLLLTPVAAGQLPPVPGETGEGREPGPRLYVPQRSFDMGTVTEGDTRVAQWVLENRGDVDLIIERTTADCGCTVVKLSDQDKVIPPGGSLELEAEFQSQGRHGAQTKHVIVHSNDPAEPKSSLVFTASVKALYTMTPSKLINLRSIRRGESVTKTLEILPTADYGSVELLDLQLLEGAPLRSQHEPFESKGKTGVRIHFIVGEDVSLGRLSTTATLRFSIDGIERKRVVPIHGHVVGDLTWTPRTLDATRQAAPRGQRLAPVSILSSGAVSFDVVEASAGPHFDVTFHPATAKRTKYNILLTLRDDAPTGPFGTTLEVRTSLLDQPIVRIPVFGIVAPLIKVDPPVILLRQDGTPAGTHRRIKLQVLPQVKLDISGITCDHDAVVAAIDREASSRYQHLRYVDVRLTGKVPPGTYQATLTVTTNIEGARRLEIPVTIEAPGGRG